MELDVHPNEIPFSGVAESQLHVKVSKDAKERTILIPITVDMGFQGVKLNQTYVTSKTVTLALSILPRLTLWDYFNNYLNSLGPVIRDLITLITAISGIVGSIIIFVWKFLGKIGKGKKAHNLKR